jgi:hypothetical protein
MRLFLVLLMSASVHAKAPAFADKKAGWEKKKETIEGLPERGFLFLSGGLLSFPGRLSFDVDSGKLRFGRGEERGGPATGPFRDSGEMEVTDAQRNRFIASANRISADEAPCRRGSPSADFDVWLRLSDGNQTKSAHCFGPPVGEVKALFEAAWAMAPEKHVRSRDEQEAERLALRELARSSIRFRRWRKEKTQFGTGARLIKEGSDAGKWRVYVSPPVEDQDIDCLVDLKTKKVACIQHGS